MKKLILSIFLIILSFSIISSAVAIPDNLIFYYKGESNGIEYVSKKVDKTLIPFNGSTFAASMPGFGNAFSCDGDDDYFSNGNYTMLENIGTNPFTLEMWVYNEVAVPPNDMLYYNDYYSSNDAGLRLMQGINTEYRPAGQISPKYINANNYFKEDEWQHFALTRFSNNSVYLYCNGTLVREDSSSDSVQETDVPMYLCDRPREDMSFGGLIDEVMIWDVGRTQDDILVDMQGYNQTEAETCANDADCGACYKCDAGTCIPQNSTEDLMDDCGVAYGCFNNYTIQSYSGFCNGAGFCNNTPLLTGVSVGNVCLDGLDADPSISRYCTIGADCVINMTSAEQYYMGFNSSGQCVDTDWQAAGTNLTWFAGYVNVSAHILGGESCSLAGIDYMAYLMYYYKAEGNGSDSVTNNPANELIASGGSGYNTSMDGFGQAFYCNDSSNFTASNNSMMTQGTGDFTVELWAYSYEDPASELVLFYDYNYDGEAGVRLVSDSNTAYAPAGQISGSYIPAGSQQIYQGVWQHWALVRYSNNNSVYLYLNDTIIAEASVGASVTEDNKPLMLCARDLRINPMNFYGLIDEVMEWSMARSSEQIAQDMQGFNITVSECDVDADCGICEKCVANECVYQTAEEDLKSECDEEYNCINAYTRQNYNGLCDGAGACNTTALQSYVSVGNVCIDGLDTDPNATVNCAIGKDCIQYNTNASEYYLGYNNSGQCVDTDWQPKNSVWSVPEGFYISVTQHILATASNCSIALHLAVPNINLTDYYYNASNDETIFVYFNPIAMQNYTYSINKTGGISSVIMGKQYNASGVTLDFAWSHNFQGIAASDKYWFGQFNEHYYIYNKTDNALLNHCEDGVGGSMLEYDPISGNLWSLVSATYNIWNRLDMWNCSILETWQLEPVFDWGNGGGISADGKYMFRISKESALDPYKVSVYDMGTRSLIRTYNETIPLSAKSDFVVPNDINYPVILEPDKVRQWNGSSWVIIYEGAIGSTLSMNFDPWSQKIRFGAGDNAYSMDFAFSPFAYNSRNAYNLYGSGDYKIGIYTSTDSESSAYNYTGNFSVIVECESDADCGVCRKCNTVNKCVYQTSAEDLKSECNVSSNCLNDYTRQNYNGLCNGIGACNVTTPYVSVGNVCIDGLDADPNATVNCAIGKDCIQYNTNASEYYLGYNNSVQCVDTDWQPKNSVWSVPEGFYISITQHILATESNCSLFAPTAITSESCSATTPVEGHAVLMPISFTVYSPSSNNNLSSPVAKIKLQSTDLTGICSMINTSIDTSAVTCNVSMQYYYPAGLYDLNVSIYDGFSAVTKYRFNASRCEYYQLLASEMSESSIIFSSASPGSGNTTADFPVLINNTGNTPFNVTLVSSNLVGRTSSNILLASYFRVGTTPSYATATQLQAGAVNTSLSVLTNNYGTLYFFVDIPRDIYPQAYYADTPWLIQIS
jgi:hypothetical protein